MSRIIPIPESRSISLHAPAKINLVLGVTGLRNDGFHELVSLVTPIAFGDTLQVTLRSGEAPGTVDKQRIERAVEISDGSAMEAPEAGEIDSGADERAAEAKAADPADLAAVKAAAKAKAIEQEEGKDILHCSNVGVPRDATNLVLKAAAAFRRQLKKEQIIFDGHFEFTLEKRIPAGAGLGGGSSDASAALSAMHTLCGSPLGQAQLYALAAEVGSDCPLFLAKAPVIMRGRGDRLTFLGDSAHTALQGQRILLFKPSFSINTGWAYGQMKAAEGRMYIGAKVIEGALATWESNPQKEPIPLFNNMQTPAFEKYVALPALLEQLRTRFTGLRCLMSGSGSACFALLDKKTAPEMVEAVKQVIRDAWGADTFIEETVLL